MPEQQKPSERLMEKRIDRGWVFAPVAACIGLLQQRFSLDPNIMPGQEFPGYALRAEGGRDRSALASGGARGSG